MAAKKKVAKKAAKKTVKKVAKKTAKKRKQFRRKLPERGVFADIGYEAQKKRVE